MERARDLAHHPRVQEELNLLDVFADGAGLFPIDKPMAAIIQPAEACRPAVCESVLGIAAVDALDDLRDDLAREPLDGRSKDDLLAWFQGRVEKITPLALNDQAREMMEADIADLRRLVGEILTSEMWTT